MKTAVRPTCGGSRVGCILLGVAALLCLPCLARAQSADERLRAIYTEEWKWRLEQFPGLEGVEKPVPDRLPKVDPATQEMRLRTGRMCCTSSKMFRKRSTSAGIRVKAAK